LLTVIINSKNASNLSGYEVSRIYVWYEMVLMNDSLFEAQGIKDKSKQQLLQKILKKSLKEKLKYGFPFSRLKWGPVVPPEPRLVLQYAPIPEPEWQILLQISNSKEPKYLIAMLTELAEAIFVHTVRAWRNKDRSGLNLKTMSSKIDIERFSSGKDIWHEIQVTTSLISDYEAGKKVIDLIKDYLQKKYNVAPHTSMKRYFEYALPILDELQVNKFIKYKTTDDIRPLVRFDKIESYLRRRVKREPRRIKCAYCKQPAYVLREGQHFCFNPSCRVLIVRKKEKQEGNIHAKKK